MTEIPTSTTGKTAAQVAREAAMMAGKVLMDSFRQEVDVSFKSPGQVVTDVDVAAQAELQAFLRTEYPDMGFLGEESEASPEQSRRGPVLSPVEGARADSGYVWIVDPIDGTRNYAFGIPFFSLVIGLVLDGKPLVGVNYDPVRNDLFEAEKGVGAFLNGRPIGVSEKTAIEDCTVGLDLAYAPVAGRNTLDVVRSIWPDMQTARIMGSSALGISYAAAGLTDIYFHHQLQPWDQVAGILLVEEAGGIITDRTGKRAGLYSDGLIASNASLHAEFMRRTEGMPWRIATHALA